MTNLNEIKAIKQSNEFKLEAALTKHIEVLKASKEWTKLIAQVMKFQSGAYTSNVQYEFDDCGMLNAYIDLDIPESFHDEDSDVMNAIAETLKAEFECLYFKANLVESNIRVEQCLGTVTTINEGCSRNEYYVHNSDLRLKFTKKDVESTEQALYLIECAMRKAGVFDSIVNVDRDGYFISFTDTKLGALSDEELAAYGKQFDESEAS